MHRLIQNKQEQAILGNSGSYRANTVCFLCKLLIVTCSQIHDCLIDWLIDWLIEWLTDSSPLKLRPYGGIKMCVLLLLLLLLLLLFLFLIFLLLLLLLLLLLRHHYHRHHYYYLSSLDTKRFASDLLSCTIVHWLSELERFAADSETGRWTDGETDGMAGQQSEFAECSWI